MSAIVSKMPQSHLFVCFSFNSGKELRVCEKVCKRWNIITSREKQLWFLMWKYLLNSPELIYDTEIQYRRLHLLFSVKKFSFYPSTLRKYSNLIPGGAEILKDKSIGLPIRILSMGLFIPSAFVGFTFLSPFTSLIDFLDYKSKHSKSKDNICTCESCQFAETEVLNNILTLTSITALENNFRIIVETQKTISLRDPVKWDFFHNLVYNHFGLDRDPKEGYADVPHIQQMRMSLLALS